MKKLLHILIGFLFLFQGIFADESPKTPKETIIVKLPNEGYRDWKEISRFLSETFSIAESCPIGQTEQNWSELISIMYNNLSPSGRATYTLDSFMKLIQKTTEDSYPGKKVTFKILEKNENEVLYEWILHEAYKDIPPQHEIARSFIRDSGFHRIGFTRRYGIMTKKERLKWIKLLKQSTLVIEFDKAEKLPDLSLAEHIL